MLPRSLLLYLQRAMYLQMGPGGGAGSPLQGLKQSFKRVGFLVEAWEVVSRVQGARED